MSFREYIKESDSGDIANVEMPLMFKELFVESKQANNIKLFDNGLKVTFEYINSTYSLLYDGVLDNNKGHSWFLYNDSKRGASLGKIKTKEKDIEDAVKRALKSSKVGQAMKSFKEYFKETTVASDIAIVEQPLLDKRRKHNKNCKCEKCCEKLTQTQAILKRG